ncbi:MULTISPECIES: hypothetical protein [Alphaproteobacteria]|jgi:hypothetical protein|uniref:hypothetical protein n=1 Tax=Alphaproteobacteria TaxID=28211 RepID=UPI000C54A164|nr:MULTISPECIES: hypothetical protein [Alphaproteobacteria]MAL73581.1 hypothetical protein [Rhodospirillaceae bacterium]MAX61815.1 hypothetical protein [Rhodospirillaceae bacterium]HAJ22940.1 hypothetical protein [Rhodospirillaceae bacterium]HBS21747.1 hypothetical protein [Thalassospira sp.]|tara:strand:- start:71 stop:1048 length:978 start_codon:yes stop_codon:yes gene_type:complete
MPGLLEQIEKLGIHHPLESKHPEIIELYNFWLESRDKFGLFNFKKFDVLNVPHHLNSKLYLTKVHRELRKFEIRIVGDEAIKNAGLDASGRFVDEVPGAEQAQLRMEFCLDNNLPYAADANLSWGGQGSKKYGVGTFPLHDNEGNVEYLLSIVCVYAKEPEEPRSARFRITCSNLPPNEIAIFNKAFDFWVQAKGKDQLPLKCKIDVTQIPRVLSKLVLYDVLEEPLDFRRRVIGEEVKALLKPQFLKKSFREQPGKGPETKVWALFETVVKTGIPRFGRLDYEGPEERISHVLALILPYSVDGMNVSNLMAIVKFFPKEKLDLS